MARSKKPTSRTEGKKNTSQSPKSEASKPETPAVADAKKITETPSSKAAVAKTDTTSSTAPKPEIKDAKPSGAAPKPDPVKPPETPKVDPAKPAESAAKAVAAKTDAKATSATPVKPADAKPVEKAESKPTDIKKPDTKPAEIKKPDPKPADAKKPETKPAEAKKSSSLPPVNSTPAKEPEKRRGVFVPLVLGGLIAGGLGFAASEYDFLKMRGNTDAIEATLAEQGARLAELGPTDLSGLEATISEVSGSVDEVSGTVASLSEMLSAIDERLSVLEDRPLIIADDGDGNGPPPEYAQQLAAYQQELETLRASVEGQKDEVARLLENAQDVEAATAEAAAAAAAAEKAAAIQAATAKLVAALSSGEPYAPVIDELTAAGIADLPDALTGPAADGVATTSTLQGAFPDVARAALGAARSAGVDAGEGGVAGFLRRQLGARSTTPREGDDPDAVLSRAEAAVRNGSVATALSEIEALPDDVKGAMEDWLSQAQTRAGAEQAIKELSERLTAN